jgi:hypothetical protein
MPFLPAERLFLERFGGKWKTGYAIKKGAQDEKRGEVSRPSPQSPKGILG